MLEINETYFDTCSKTASKIVRFTKEGDHIVDTEAEEEVVTVADIVELVSTTKWDLVAPSRKIEYVLERLQLDINANFLIFCSW